MSSKKMDGSVGESNKTEPKATKTAKLDKNDNKKSGTESPKKKSGDKESNDN